MALVNSKPADFFGTEHVPVMVEYVRAVCRGHVIDDQLKAFDPEWMATDEGLRRYEKLVGMGNKTAGMVKTLATSMRLTHHAVWQKNKSGLRDGPGKKTWERESN